MLSPPVVVAAAATVGAVAVSVVVAEVVASGWQWRRFVAVAGCRGSRPDRKIHWPS